MISMSIRICRRDWVVLTKTSGILHSLDSDRIYRFEFRKQLDVMGIQEVLSALDHRGSPQHYLSSLSPRFFKKDDNCCVGRAMAPGELLLYEWYAFKRDAKLFGSLEKAEVQAGPESQDAT